MRLAVSLFALTLVVTTFSWIAWPKDGLCLPCLWTGACYNNSICGSGCICVKRDSIDISGYCASL